MSHEIRADPEDLRRLADVELDSSRTLSAQRDTFTEATELFASSAKKFGNLRWSAQISSATLAAAEDSKAAATALSAATTRDVDALYQTAANYQELDEGLGDDIHKLWERTKKIFS